MSGLVQQIPNTGGTPEGSVSLGTLTAIFFGAATVYPYVGRIWGAGTKAIESVASALDTWQKERAIKTEAYQEILIQVKELLTSVRESQEQTRQALALSLESQNTIIAERKTHDADNAAWKKGIEDMTQVMTDQRAAAALLLLEKQDLEKKLALVEAEYKIAKEIIEEDPTLLAKFQERIKVKTDA